MNPANPKRSPKSTLAAEDVAEYLGTHPRFFEHHLDLLETLEVPHRSGAAVSLVARQIEVLRDKNRFLDIQLNDIVQIARENDILYQRIHQLTLTLLAARGLEDALAGLEWGLSEYFQIDFVAVRITEPVIVGPIANLHLPADSPQLALFGEVVDTGKARCGIPEPEQAAALFGELAGEVASLALVPLQYAGLRGLLAIGSRDADRFQTGMGALFLTQLGEILSARLAAMLLDSGRDGPGR
jgi:uncharacterized protein YigA (DUF484 family)